MDSNSESGGDEFVELVDQCIGAYTELGPGAVEKIIDAHPEQAERLRGYLQNLERLGLLGAPAEHLPESFGPYTILGRIGRGGMSEVFLAHDPRVGREVALKCAHPGMALEGRSRQRFQREVQAVAKLSHAGIVPVYDAGDSDGRAYFTMEYAEGVTLADALRMLRDTDSGGEPRAKRIAVQAGAEDLEARPWQRSYIELVSRWVLALAEALEHAHRAGVIHRDVNPSNVIVRSSGQVQLFDFGLARVSDAPSLTHAGEFTGTPYYVSPEQAGGQSDDVDERCDMYSLGVTLYELLTLRRPFEGASTNEVLSRIQSSEPTPPRQHDGHIPRDLELICLTAMERDPERRYTNMAEFAADLRSFLAFEPVKARPPSTLSRGLRWLRKRPGVAAGLLILSVVVIGLPPVMLRINAAVVRERDAALEAAEESARSALLARQVEDFLVGLFEADPENSEALSVSELITHGLDRLPHSSVREGESVEYALLETVGRMYSKLGDHDRARQIFTRAFQVREHECGPDDLGLVRLHVAVGNELLNGGVSNAAHHRGELGITLLDRLGLISAPLRSACLTLMSEADMKRGEVERAKIHFDAATEVRLGMDANAAIESEVHVADLALAFERYGVARDAYRRAITAELRTGEGGFAFLVDLRVGLAKALVSSGEVEAAREVQRASEVAQGRLEAWRETLGVALPVLPANFLTGSWRGDFNRELRAGIKFFIDEDYESARSHFLRCFDWDPTGLSAAFNLACVESRLGNLDACFAWLDRALEMGLGRTNLPSLLSMENEPDLIALQGDPRLESFFQKLQLAQGEPLAYQFQSPEEGQKVGVVLVRLLPAGMAVDQFQDDALARAALDLGWDLVTMAVPNPGGFRNTGWLISQAEFIESSAELRERVMDSLTLDLGLKYDTMLIAGEAGSGPVATSLALHHSEMFDGLVLLDSYPGLEQRSPSLRRAALAGLRVVIADRVDVDVGWAANRVSQAQFSEGVEAWFKALTLDTRLISVGPGEALDRVLVALTTE